MRTRNLLQNDSEIQQQYSYAQKGGRESENDTNITSAMTPSLNENTE